MKTLIIVLFAVFLSSGLSAQYHLSEIGLSLGGGAAIPLGYKSTAPSYGINANAFFSHWVCGKRYGYQGELGFRNFNASAKDGLLLPPGTVSDKSSFAFSFLNLGFYFKVRKNEYHRWYETALLVGPKVDFMLSGRHSTGTLTGRKSENIKLLPVSPGIHVSLWVKRKFFSQALYIQPGLEYFPLNILSTPSDVMSGMYAFLNIGITFWNTKQTGFKASH